MTTHDIVWRDSVSGGYPSQVRQIGFEISVRLS